MSKLQLKESKNLTKTPTPKSNGGTTTQQVSKTPLMQRKSKEQQAIFGNNTIQKKENNTGLPDNLKSGIESLSGYSMDDVKVHYDSSQPAQLNAHAFAQGSDIHLASGAEKHLPHEAWHVVQQKQGRVQPTRQMKEKVNINDNEGLEREADVMGGKALQRKDGQTSKWSKEKLLRHDLTQVVQPRNNSQKEKTIQRTPASPSGHNWRLVNIQLLFNDFRNPPGSLVVRNANMHFTDMNGVDSQGENRNTIHSIQTFQIWAKSQGTPSIRFEAANIEEVSSCDNDIIRQIGADCTPFQRIVNFSSPVIINFDRFNFSRNMRFKITQGVQVVTRRASSIEELTDTLRGQLDVGFQINPIPQVGISASGETGEESSSRSRNELVNEYEVRIPLQTYNVVQL
ncbi:DUF4157 domain-containing protein [Sulfurovum sp. bin170]|uniref:eCIS core domain-containing protein n=1 Tax=Sulfurovum sp. bin170 TaxID=2695268 RepID=UPI0013DFD922|nr:DUF4157 domain-containing protein [Sulfurovum sp. bin170]NEW61113.1 DUF4157 domain-containing protein [Sulfurovum sp. bin170]